MVWDPAQYLRFSTERHRPFFDLIGQLGAESPDRVVDLGCGTGELTAALTRRWPSAVIEGVDSSPQMLARAHKLISPDPGTITVDIPTGAGLSGARLSFTLGAAAEFDAAGVDVVISNALLQWVPDHLPLLARWAGQLNPGGWLAFQVPANFDAPSHAIMRELAGSSRWRAQLGQILRHADAVAEPADYVDSLSAAGLTVTGWQTTYLHILHGPDPVLEWVSGTGLRPILSTLDDKDRALFVADFAIRLRAAYPERPYGTVFDFKRTFIVAHKKRADDR